MSDNGIKQLMESRFGYDYNNVRIHLDSKSAELIIAAAYTLGEDIVFGKGHYSTSTGEGRRLLAHELIHVIHQNQTHQIGSELVLRGPPPRTSTKGRTVSNPALSGPWKLDGIKQPQPSRKFLQTVIMQEFCLPPGKVLTSMLYGEVIIRSSCPVVRAKNWNIHLLPWHPLIINLNDSGYAFDEIADCLDRIDKQPDMIESEY